MNLMALGNHLWQSTIFAAAAWLLVRTLRRNSARVRYLIWMLASLKFLVPFSPLIALGDHLSSPAQRQVATVNVPVIEFIGSPFGLGPFQPESPAPKVITSTPRPASSQPLADLVLAIWLVGVASVAASRAVRVRRVREILSSARRLEGGPEIEAIERSKHRRILARKVGCATTESVIEPGVYGILRPILVLPSGVAERLETGQLETIVDHELCHIRRHDNLRALIHMSVEMIFWFHPLIWWIGARLVDERERACDEQVLEDGYDPRVYASAILKVCEFYVASPLACVAGVSGGNLKRRIEEIMRQRMVQKLSWGKKLLLAGLAMLAVGAPTIVGVLTAPSIRAQSPTPPAEPRPKFEVASVKPCKPEAGFSHAFSVLPDGGASIPDRVSLNCVTLSELIRQAYVVHGSGHLNGNELATVPIEGGPQWINSDGYQIDAKAEDAPGQDMLQGPAMQGLLEERFRLKIRHEIREVPVYALTVAKGGPKLEPSKDGCRPLELSRFQWCLGQPIRGGDSFRLMGVTMTDLSKFLSLSERSDRPTIDETGITGRFNVPLPGRPSEVQALEPLRAALQALGLDLQPAMGPSDLLVIDSVDRPLDN